MSAIIKRLHEAFHEPGTRINHRVQGGVWALILLSILLLVLDGVLALDNPLRTRLPQLDRAILIIFAIELVLRVASFQPPALKVFRPPPVGRVRAHRAARLGFLLRPIMLVDILAVLALFPELRGLRALRLLRLLRTTKVFHYRNPFAIVLQVFEENGLLFAMAFSVLAASALLGGVSFYLVEVNLNSTVDTMVNGIWWALVTITTVGFGDVTPVTPLGRLIGAVMMVAGMFTLALFAGTVGSSLVSGMLSIREEQFRMSDYVNHVVVCGYDESTNIQIDSLSTELNLAETRVVLFDDHERPRESLPDIIWAQGVPTKESEMDKVRLTHAAAVIVSGNRDTPPQEADARTILITFTIRAYLNRRRKIVRRRLAPLYVVAEILDSENGDHARTAGADEVIETRRIGYAMIAHAVGFHGTATDMSRVLMDGTHNVYIGKIPGDRTAPFSFGDLLVELQLSKRGGLVVGLRTKAGREIINPPKSHMLDPGTELLYLSEVPCSSPRPEAPIEGAHRAPGAPHGTPWRPPGLGRHTLRF